MSPADIIIILIVLVLFIGSILYMRKYGTCTENCASCHGVCHQNKKKGSEKTLVERYRADHPTRGS